MKKTLFASAIVLSLASNMAFATDTTAANTTNNPKAQHKMEFKAKRDELLAKLPKAKRDLFNNTMKKTREANKEHFEKLKSIHEEMKAMLIAPSFDKSAYMGKAAEALTVEDAIHTSMVESVASIASNYTADERKILAKLVSRHHRHHGKWDHHKKDGDKSGATGTTDGDKTDSK